MMDLQKYADLIINSEKTGTPIEPISTEIGTSDINLAYDIQKIVTQQKVNQGARIVGKKIGLTSPKVQQQFGINQPDFGVLFNHMELLTGSTVSISNFFNVRAEAELAFILNQDLDLDDITILDVIESIDFVLPSIELVDSRIRDWKIKITDTIADNASASHYILGHTPKTLDEIDVINCSMKLLKNGSLVSEGSGEDCLGSPLNAVYWLAKKSIEMGDCLKEGDIILSGALGPMIPIEEGDRIKATFEGLGSVSLNFE